MQNFFSSFIQIILISKCDLNQACWDRKLQIKMWTGSCSIILLCSECCSMVNWREDSKKHTDFILWGERCYLKITFSRALLKKNTATLVRFSGFVGKQRTPCVKTEQRRQSTLKVVTRKTICFTHDERDEWRIRLSRVTTKRCTANNTIQQWTICWLSQSIFALDLWCCSRC